MESKIWPLAQRTDVTQIPPPRNVDEAREHPEANVYMKAFMKELKAFKDTGNLEVPAD